MRNLRKYLAVVVAVAMLITMFTPAIAASGNTYSTEATKLNAMGLYQGVSTTSFDPDLGSTLDRQTAAVFLARLAGLEQEANDSDLAEAKATLKAKFKDAGQIADWAAKHIALYVDAGVIKGFPDGTFQPKGLVTGRQFCTMALKQLGYEVPSFEEAGAQFAEVAGLDEAQQTEFEVNSAIKKSVLIGISFKALGTPEAGKDTTLIESLVKSGVVDEAKAEEAGFTVTPAAPTAAPTAAGEQPTVAPTDVPVHGAVYGAVAAVNDLPVGNLSTGSTVNKVFKFTVTAPADQDMTITSFLAKKYGTSAADTTDVSKVYLVEGDTILVSGTLNNGEVRLNKSIVITKGTTKTYCLAVDIHSTTAVATRTVVLGLDSASSVVSTPSVAPFTAPLMGGTYGIISASIGSLSAVTGGDQGVTTVKVGEMSKDLGNFQLTSSSTEDLSLTNLTLTAVGLTASNFDNLYIYDETLTKIDVKGVVSGSKITFSFGDKAPTITKSNTKKFYLKGDVISGVNTSGQFKIDNNYDIVAKGLLSGANVAVTMSTATSLLSGANSITVAAGTPTVVDTSNVPTKVVATSSTKGLIREWQVTSPSEEMNITSMVFTLTYTGGALTTTIGSIYVTDENGNVIAGPVAASAVSGNDVTFSNVNWYVPANTAKKFQLRATTYSDSIGSNFYIDAQVKASGLSYTLTTTNTQSSVAASAVPASASTKNVITAGTLTASTDSTSVAKSLPAGSKNANVARYLLGASNDKIKITKVRVTVTTAGSAPTLSGYISNMGLYVNGALKGVKTAAPTNSSAAPTGYFDLDISSDPLYIEKDQTVQVEVRADVDQDPLGASNYTFQFTTATAYSNSTNVTLSGSNISGNPTGGTLTVDDGTLELTDVASGQVLADKVLANTQIEFVKGKYTADNEDVTLTQIHLRSDSSNVAANRAVKNIKVYEGTTLLAEYPSMTVSPTAVDVAIPLNKATLLIPDGESKTVVVKGELDKDSFVSGENVTFWLITDTNDYTKGTGALSNKTIYPANVVLATGGQLTQVDAKVEVAKTSDSPSGSQVATNTTPVLKFTVKANGADVYVSPSAINVTTGGNATGVVPANGLMKMYRVEANGTETVVSAMTLSGAQGQFIVGNTDTDAAYEVSGVSDSQGLAIADGQTATFIVRFATTWSPASSGSDKVLSVSLDGLKIADTTGNPAAYIYDNTSGSGTDTILSGNALTVN